METATPLEHLLTKAPALADAIVTQMERVLADDIFRRAPRISQLLRFLVTMSLQGKTSQLKEYTIAVDVFKRPETVDCRLDSIVRVEIARLRKKLTAFYQTTGIADHFVLALPRTGYIPMLYKRTEQHARRHSEPIVGLIEGAATSSKQWLKALRGEAADIVCVRRDTEHTTPFRYDVLIVVAMDGPHTDRAHLLDRVAQLSDVILFVGESPTQAAWRSVTAAIQATSVPAVGNVYAVSAPVIYGSQARV